jgi:aminoglycoside 6'-N-acetyltransferase I
MHEPATEPLRCRTPNRADDADWLALRLRLWPEGSAQDHREGMADSLRRGHYVCLALSSAGEVMGFVEAAIRSDYVNGTQTSPAGFLEGIYVLPPFRRQGIARALVQGAAEWAQANGCSEFASDALLDNHESHAMHRALGFSETERVVCFVRRLTPGRA